MFILNLQKLIKENIPKIIFFPVEDGVIGGEELVFAYFYQFSVKILLFGQKLVLPTQFWVSKSLLFCKAWKLKDEERLLDIVDPDLTECPDEEIMRFIIVALFCTQAVSNQRPSMSQVVEMLSKKVNLNVKLLTEPGIHRRNSSSSSKGGLSQETTKSGASTGRKSINPFVASSPHVSNSFDSMSQMFPR